jgi:L-serine/L-threonine ammonia-lyase
MYQLVSSEVMLSSKYYYRVMVPAYDSPILWQGHASMIKEIAYQVPNRPDAIFCSVGGGGLLGGVLVGCKDVGWDDSEYADDATEPVFNGFIVPVVAMETHGSNCFYHSVSVNVGQFNSAKVLPQDVETWHDEGYNVSLARVKKLKSRASSLGASSPAPAVVKMALEREGGIKCVCVPDELTMQTNISFAGASDLVASAPVDRPP